MTQERIKSPKTNCGFIFILFRDFTSGSNQKCLIVKTRYLTRVSQNYSLEIVMTSVYGFALLSVFFFFFFFGFGLAIHMKVLCILYNLVLLGESSYTTVQVVGDVTFGIHILWMSGSLHFRVWMP